MTLSIRLDRLPLGADDSDGWEALPLDPALFVRAALQRERRVPLGIVPGAFAWVPGDVVRLTARDEESATHVLGVVVRDPETGERHVALAPAYPGPTDRTFGADLEPVPAYALWRGEAGASALLRRCGRVPGWRVAEAARLAAGVALAAHGDSLPDAIRLYERAVDARGTGLLYAFRQFARPAPPAIEVRAELHDSVRATRDAHGASHCATLAVGYFTEMELRRRRDFDDDCALAATAVLWAEHAADPGAVRAAVHCAVPLWAFVAALAGVPEDDCG